ncbi:DUF2306 domain-containing protein [Phreatobacter stygius]|nr:DUF2306 domain-containing protein [Phreatobacter stygius]
MSAPATAPIAAATPPLSLPVDGSKARAPARFMVKRIVLAVIVAVLVLPLGAVAVMTAAGWLALPYELAVVDERLPGLFRLHMAAAAAALVLVPVALLVRRRPALHRIVGRAAGIAILIAGTSAIPVALSGLASAMAVAGFIAQAVTWLVLMSLGFVAIRRRRVHWHARAMVAVAAVTSAAIWLRPAMVLVREVLMPHADWSFDTAYAVVVWASWLLPLTAVAAVMGLGRWPGRARI